jgi:hypothetical protein
VPKHGRCACSQSSSQDTRFVYTPIKALFSSGEKLKTFQDFPSHQIFARMHGALNVGKKLIAQFVCNLGDESFDPT